jgi:predicted XRE-type DNA-binding protein
VKITSVTANNRKKAFEVKTRRGQWLFPYSKCDLAPTPSDPLAKLFIDPELGREGFTFVLASGAEDSVHIDHVFAYNEEPGYMRDLLLFNLTVDALEHIEASPLSKREIIRRLGTSPAQLYRLLDTTNYRKSVDKMLSLLQVLDCEVEVVVRKKSA